MSSVTFHFHITWFVCFSCCSPAYLLKKKNLGKKKQSEEELTISQSVSPSTLVLAGPVLAHCHRVIM